MMESWADCSNILVIRPDNMGDLIMSGPAIRALKHTFLAKITVLTSSMAAGIARHMPEIDDVLVFDMPWIRAEKSDPDLFNLVEAIRIRHFDAAVIFTVYSQSALPSALLACQAGIRKTLAYCRENPYGLISHWLPDREPYQFIRHQVERDTALAAAVGAYTADQKLNLQVTDGLWECKVHQQLSRSGVNTGRPWLILHAGVSEKKREYPADSWVAVAKTLIARGYQVLFTGSAAERTLTDNLQGQTGAGSYSLAGHFKLEEFICLVKNSPLLVSVNTGAVHIAAAVGTPVVVLYARTNPQHQPWQVAAKVLEYSIPTAMQSKNEIVAWVNERVYGAFIPVPSAAEVVDAVIELLSGRGVYLPKRVSVADS